MKEILKLTPNEGQSIVGEDHEDFVTIKEDIIDTSRWCIIYDIVVKRVSDGKFFKSSYRVGATESQDERPYEYDSEAIFTEVVPVEKTIIAYE